MLLWEPCKNCKQLQAETAALKAEVEKWQEQVCNQGEVIEKLKVELAEQCRIIGIGSEREAALLGKVTRLEAELAKYQAAMNPSERLVLRLRAELAAAPRKERDRLRAKGVIWLEATPLYRIEEEEA